MPPAARKPPLPSNVGELEDLSKFMAMHESVLVESGRPVMFSPLAHAWCLMACGWQAVEEMGMEGGTGAGRV